MSRTSLTVVLAVVPITAVEATHASVTVPDGLLPGDTYHLAFVTNGTIDGWSTDIAVYNSFVNDEAALHPDLAGVTWSALVGQRHLASC